MVANMKDISIICPVCEEDIIIPAREIKLAVRHKATTCGKALVGCPNCSRALALPDPLPETDAELEAWPGNISDVLCIAMLNDEDVKIPAGKFDNLGKVVYRPGGGGPALMKRPYMAKYGIDPEKALAKMGRGGEEPFAISGIGRK